MRLVITNSPKNIKNYFCVKTPKRYSEGIKIISQYVRDNNHVNKYKMAIIGLPGPVNQQRGILEIAPNLADWGGKHIVRDIAAITRSKIIVRNDTELVGLGEVHYGAGAKKGITAYLTVSTGVGGVRIIDGKVDKYANGFEIGHQIIDSQAIMNNKGQLCVICHSRGHIEVMLGGRYVSSLEKKKSARINVQQRSTYLAYLLNNTIAYWSPHTIVIGGGMYIGGKVNLATARTILKKIFTIQSALPIIRGATLGDAGGLYGALHIAKET